jgi:hypothetical protein
LSDGAPYDHLWIGQYSNSYVTWTDCLYECFISGDIHVFELPDKAIRPTRKPDTNVNGCGLVLDPEEKLWLFFTLNGQLLGELVLETLSKLINFNIKHI